MKKIVVILSSIIFIAAQQKQSVDIRPDVLFERVNDAYTNVNAGKSVGNSNYNTISSDVTVSTFAGSGTSGSAMVRVQKQVLIVRPTLLGVREVKAATYWLQIFGIIKFVQLHHLALLVMLFYLVLMLQQTWLTIVMAIYL